MIGKQTSRTAETPAQNNDMWIRLGWVWFLLFYLSVIIPVFFFLLDEGTKTADRRAIVIIAGLTILWHVLGTIILPRRFPRLQGHPITMSIVMAGIVAAWYVLVGFSMVFFFMMAGLFSQVFFLLPPRIAIPGSIFITAMFAYLQITGDGSPFTMNGSLLFIYGLMAAIAILIALWIHAIIGQSVKRRELIEELERSQSELAVVERRAGVLAERQRLAHEIHDTLAQGFTSIIMHLEAADQALPTDTATVQTHLDYARTTARDSLQQARRVVDNLRPQSLEGHTLPEAIKRAAVRWSEEVAIVVECATSGQVLPLHPDIEVTLLRAAQEALNNVRKHASASQVDITLSYFDNVVILDVQDNGMGIKEILPHDKNRTDGGFGLVAMRQRVAQFNGSVTLESDPGEGTTLVVEIPVGDE